MTFVSELGQDIKKNYLHARKLVSRSKHSKVTLPTYKQMQLKTFQL